MKMSASKKRPGSRLMVFAFSTFWPFFLASTIGSFVVDVLGLTLSAIILGGLFIVMVFATEQILLKRSLNKNQIELIGTSKSGIRVYKIDDPLANAMAMGIGKRLGYILVTTGLIGLLGQNKAEYEVIVEHEENHVNQMHNLTILLTVVLLLVVWLSILSINTTAFQFVLYYTLVILMILVLLRTLMRGLETLADKTSDPLSLNAALSRMDKYNCALRKKKTSKRMRLFSTHPKTEERPKRPNLVQNAAICGTYISSLMILAMIMRILTNIPFSDITILLIISILFSVMVLVVSFVVLDYLVLSKLLDYLAQRFKVKPFHSTTTLNGIISVLVVSGIPVITHVTSEVILVGSFFGALVIAVIVTALGTEPFKKGILAAILGWVVNSAIFFLAFYALVRITQYVY